MRGELPLKPEQPIELAYSWYIGGFKDAWFTGEGMMHDLEQTFRGQWKKDRKVKGKLRMEDEENEFNVEYDADKDFENGVNFNKQVPVNKY